MHASVPSHTDTDIMIEHIGSKTIFPGDNCIINRIGRFDNSASIIGNLNALEALNKREYNLVVQGHGPSGSKAVALQPYLDYLNKLKQVVEQGLDEELEDYEIKQAFIDDFSEFKGWVGFKERFGVNINKMYLELEAF